MSHDFIVLDNIKDKKTFEKQVSEKLNEGYKLIASHQTSGLTSDSRVTSQRFWAHLLKMD